MKTNCRLIIDAILLALFLCFWIFFVRAEAPEGAPWRILHKVRHELLMLFVGVWGWVGGASEDPLFPHRRKIQKGLSIALTLVSLFGLGYSLYNIGIL